MPRSSASPRSRDRTVDADQVARFAAMAEEWWDPRGKFRPLHRLNPTRVAFVRDRAAAHFGRDATADLPLDGLRLIDIGCGGGLLAEPLARLGASVVGLDAGEDSIGIARSHAGQSGLAIDYRCQSIEDVAASDERFDIVLNMEVVEHVADLDTFLGASAAVLATDGMMIVATLNRTLKAYALAIVGAEYVLRWLPRGTHDWSRFVRPAELAATLRRHGVAIAELTGVVYNPLSDSWALSRDLSVNYMALATRA